MPKPSFMNFSSAAGEWTRRTSASPFSPIAIACPDPTAIVFTKKPVFFSNAGIRTSRSPESCVLVVVARIRFFDAAVAGTALNMAAAHASATTRNANVFRCVISSPLMVSF